MEEEEDRLIEKRNDEDEDEVGHRSWLEYFIGFLEFGAVILI